jgi:CheY-like chemotaxis protein
MGESSGKTVLVVEDMATSRERIVSILNDLGCRVLEAEDGLAGLALAKEHSRALDLVVLDIQMPHLDGITTLRYLRQLPGLGSVPVVMLTTQVDTETVRTALAHHATDFIRKDASLPRIAERLRRYLEGAVEPPGLTPAVARRDGAAILQGCRRYHPGEPGPYVLFFEPQTDVQALAESRDRGLLAFYEHVVTTLEAARLEYPGLTPGYDIEHEALAVTRLVKRDTEALRLVMISTRRGDGVSLARMVRLVRQGGPPVVLMSDAVGTLSLEQREAIAKPGVEVVERSHLLATGMAELIDRYVAPQGRITASGLRFLELARGVGDPPEVGQWASVHYRARSQPGGVYDDTRRQGQPRWFAVGQGAMVAGLDEAVQLLRPGGRARLVIPPHLGFAGAGYGEIVPPDATLIVDVELLAAGPTAPPE